MTRGSITEYVKVIRGRYLIVSRKEKGRILEVPVIFARTWNVVPDQFFLVLLQEVGEVVLPQSQKLFLVFHQPETETLVNESRRCHPGVEATMVARLCQSRQ